MVSKISNVSSAIRISQAEFQRAGEMRHIQRSVFSRTAVGTLDRTRLTSGLKMKTAQEFNEKTAEKGLSELSMSRSYYLPKQLGSLTNLTNLRLGHRYLSTLAPSIGKCSKLKVLNLFHTASFLVFPKEIGQCKELEEVNLAFTSILRLDELDQCPKLKKIVLSDHSLEKGLRLTPRTVALLERLNIKIPPRKEDPLAEEVYELQLPPENMDEIDLEELAGKQNA